MPILTVSSLCSSRTHEPMVDLTVPSGRAQFSPDKARHIAHMLLDAAESATADAFLYDWACNVLGQQEDVAVGIISDFRKYRENKLVRETEVEEVSEDGRGVGAAD